MKGGDYIKALKRILLRFLVRIGALFCCLVLLLTGSYSVAQVYSTASKGSALYEIEHANLLITIIAMLPIYLVWNLFVILIEVISISISNYKLSEKLTNRLYRLGILISLVVSMLYTETADQFQLLATLISFCLIFQFLIPNDFQNLHVDIKRNAHQKRAKHKNKKENQ